MPRIGLLFELRRAETQPGEGVRVVGNWPVLGKWEAMVCSGDEARELRTSALVYPRWTMQAPVWLCWGEDAQDGGSCLGPEGKLHVEYKFVRHSECHSPGKGRSVSWEDDIPNRRTSLAAEDGSIWLISDACWSRFGEPTRVARVSFAEVASRWAGLDPEAFELRPPRRPSVQATIAPTPGAIMPTPVMLSVGPPDNFMFSPRRPGDASSPSPKPRRRRMKSNWTIEDEFQALSPSPDEEETETGEQFEQFGQAKETGDGALRKGGARAQSGARAQRGAAAVPRLALPGMSPEPVRPQTRQQSSSRQQRIREIDRLRRENQQLRRICKEADALRLENRALRARLQAAESAPSPRRRVAKPSTPKADKTMQEPQEEPTTEAEAQSMAEAEFAPTCVGA